jgi:hypothetical protein
MPAPYNGNPAQYPASIDCPVDADPPNAWATTHPLQQLADRTANLSRDLPKTTLSNLWTALQKFTRGITVTNSDATKPGVQASGGPHGGTGVIGTGNEGGKGLVGIGDGSGAGVQGSSAQGPGGQFLGNASRAALTVVPQTAPSRSVAGDLFIDSASGLAKLKTAARWASLVLTGQPTQEPVILNGGTSDDSPARQMTAVPVARKLVDEFANAGGQKTRIYATTSGMEVTTNCAWSASGNQWVPDIAGASTKTSFTSIGIAMRTCTATGAFADAAFDDASQSRGFTLGADADLLWQGRHTVNIPGGPPLTGGWGPGITSVLFAKDAAGTIHITGQVANGRLGYANPIFTLPPGYLPGHNQNRVVPTGSNFGFTAGVTPGLVVIAASGDVVLLAGDVRAVQLDLSFLAGF